MFEFSSLRCLFKSALCCMLFIFEVMYSREFAFHFFGLLKFALFAFSTFNGVQPGGGGGRFIASILWGKKFLANFWIAL